MLKLSNNLKQNNSFFCRTVQHSGFTLTEILLAITIVGIIAALVLPAVITNYQDKSLNMGFERELKTIKGAVKNLAVSENKTDFYSTMMYSDSDPGSYSDSSGKFLKKYLKVSNYCGDSNGDCFAPVYYTYNGTKREVYTPTYKGACASLKNGASICITPQIGAAKIAGLLDLNGKKGPNVLGRDLREFEIDQETYKVGLVSDTSDVLASSETDLTPKESGPCKENSMSKECCDTKSVKKGDPCCTYYLDQEGHVCHDPSQKQESCATDQNSLDCCKTRSVTAEDDPCCNYSDIINTHDICRKVHISFKLTATGTSVGLRRYKGDFTQTGYNDPAKYQAFVLYSSGAECEQNGVKVDCNDYSRLSDSSNRFFSKDHTGHITSFLAISGCYIMRDREILQSFGASTCRTGITMTYTPNPPNK